ncbi:SURF1 family protein [Stutzerimonas tarimensis]|uniref:SURF1-like protein n=1 Tax=Stutzerimonas tarimensis TaxID=1507735 RepID=A0ABV7T0X3_9GAMM
MRDSDNKGGAVQYSLPPDGILARLVGGFRSGWLPTVLVCLLLPSLVWLGTWQLARADEKRSLLAQYEARRSAEPVALTSLDGAADPAYRRVRLLGRFDGRHSLLLDSRIQAGQVGVELLQPFSDRLSGLQVLVNRGWLVWPDRRQPVLFDTPEQVIELNGWIYLPPGKGLRLSEVEGKGWPRLINRVEPSALWLQLAVEGYPHEVRLEPGPAALTVDWPVVATSPDMHLGYAVQWFALAAALLGLFIYLGIYNAREARHGNP